MIDYFVFLLFRLPISVECLVFKVVLSGNSLRTILTKNSASLFLFCHYRGLVSSIRDYKRCHKNVFHIDNYEILDNDTEQKTQFIGNSKRRKLNFWRNLRLNDIDQCRNQWLFYETSLFYYNHNISSSKSTDVLCPFFVILRFWQNWNLYLR